MALALDPPQVQAAAPPRRRRWSAKAWAIAAAVALHALVLLAVLATLGAATPTTLEPAA